MKIVITCVTLLVMASCKKINVFEKQITIPNYKWSNKFVPTFEFKNNTDSNFNLVTIVVRHTNNYPYSNLWVKLTTIHKQDTTTKDCNILLTKNNANKEWANEGMDDIHEIRYPVKTVGNNSNDYTFMISNIMTDTILPEIMNIGLRVEKIGY